MDSFKYCLNANGVCRIVDALIGVTRDDNVIRIPKHAISSPEDNSPSNSRDDRTAMLAPQLSVNAKRADIFEPNFGTKRCKTPPGNKRRVKNPAVSIPLSILS